MASGPSLAAEAIAPLQPRLVSLVGLMGTGKTTVAAALAERFAWGSLDLDHAIEHDSGLTITAIFQAHGEGTFRQIEGRVLAEVLASHRDVFLATGGGAPCQPGAMERLRDAGLVIWLDATPDVLVSRALTNDRPLLAGRSPSEAEAFLAGQLEKRRPYYGAAHHRVDASRPLAEVVDEVVGLIGHLLPNRS